MLKIIGTTLLQSYDMDMAVLLTAALSNALVSGCSVIIFTLIHCLVLEDSLMALRTA